MTITTLCNDKNNSKDKVMKQELPEYALCILNESKDGISYLMSVALFTDYQQRNVAYKKIGNGDYFLYYHTEYKSANTKPLTKELSLKERAIWVVAFILNKRPRPPFWEKSADTVDRRIVESNNLHIIPDNNGRYRMESQMQSSTFYENGENIGHAEPSGEWNFAGYSDDENSEAAKILKYFNDYCNK